MKRVYHDYNKIMREYNHMIKEMEVKLEKIKQEFDQEVKDLKDTPNSNQISRIIFMVERMHSLEEDIKKFIGHRSRDWKLWLDDLREQHRQ